MLSLGFKNAVCIGNLVPQYEEVCRCTKEKVIIHVGRLDKIQKRQHLLVEAFGKIAKRYPDWKVKFYGGDSNPKSYQSELQELICKHNLEKQVLLMGKSNKIDKELSKASIFAFPSAYEGFGLALTEAMSCGLPAVGFKNCPAVNELIIDGKSGVLCEESVDAFSEALEFMIENNDLCVQMGINAKEDMRQYAPGKIWNKWEDLLKGFEKQLLKA